MCVCVCVCVCSDVSDSLQPHGLVASPGFSVHGIFQARILEWVAIPTPGDLPNPGTEHVSLVSPELADKFFTA